MKVGVKLGTVHTQTRMHTITTSLQQQETMEGGFHTNNHTQHNTIVGENQDTQPNRHFKSTLHCTLAQHQRHRATAVQEWNVWVMIIQLIIMC